MLRKASETVPEDNGPVPQKEEFGFHQPTWKDVYRRIKAAFDQLDRKLDEISDMIEERTSIDQRLTRLEHGARQARLAMEADGQASTKTRERTEGAATAVQAVHGDSCSAQKAQDGPKTNSISFGEKPEPPALPCRDDVVVESGDAAPQSCLPSVKMRITAAAGGFVPTGKTSTATETIYNQPPLRFYSTKGTDPEANCKKTLPLNASYDSSIFQMVNLPAACFCRRAVETKSRQNRTFDPGGSQGHLRACPFLGTWRALVCGGAVCAGAAGIDCSSFLEDR